MGVNENQQLQLLLFNSWSSNFLSGMQRRQRQRQRHRGQIHFEWLPQYPDGSVLPSWSRAFLQQRRFVLESKSRILVYLLKTQLTLILYSTIVQDYVRIGEVLPFDHQGTPRPR